MLDNLGREIKTFDDAALAVVTEVKKGNSIEAYRLMNSTVQNPSMAIEMVDQ